jgi:hypothetical protein
MKRISAEIKIAGMLYATGKLIKQKTLHTETMKYNNTQ